MHTHATGALRYADDDGYEMVDVSCLSENVFLFADKSENVIKTMCAANDIFWISHGQTSHAIMTSII